ncbi:phosphate ABC transporter substrate-binding protein PstS [Roseateles saccharophilus]|uniref:Phosphate-binding protein PstS n=1 Tax=Roseateles saccharophilus TaxID=304 RepID=A0A4R3URR7_ROSSA|nr:phosphate ABC transporter substrate-binding protein PstS [Roseateles saccharophilus]MDG0833443.1 phosphate ABC transporter substrate-binding protein PstS [Roseateles saccharophilus]TCU93098.1 phosphate ABC transporter substrate-binding protein (PhoT family) [Roseateles saccharophilus]
MSVLQRLIPTLAASLLLAAPAFSQAVQGQGATFPSQVYETWAKAFAKAGGGTVAYKGTGSGDGIKQITARKVDFGGTDAPLPPAELAKQHLVQIPMLVGGVVPVVNLPGLGAPLQLDGAVLADIFQGRIKAWNDGRIAALNPGVGLPGLAIRRVVRAEKSGTTDGFTRYLAGASAAFKTEVGAGQSPAWPGEPLKAEGNDGMVQKLRATPGAIAYVSYDRVLRDKLVAVKLRNVAGHFVLPTEAGFRAAILESDMHRQGDDLATLLDRPGSEAWPITLTSFVLVDAEPATAPQALGALKFLYWSFMHGDELTRGTGFAPLPISVQSRLAARFTQVKPKDGKLPVYQSF